MKTILLVDDDEDLLALLELHLKITGYECLIATNGEQAQQLLELKQPDLLILDMMMPVLNGLDFLIWLRQTHALEVPVLALTGMTLGQTEAKLWTLGVKGVLFKPVAPQQLIQEIKKILLQ